LLAAISCLRWGKDREGLGGGGIVLHLNMAARGGLSWKIGYFDTKFNHLSFMLSTRRCGTILINGGD